MEARQPWLSGSARSLKSPALSPPGSFLPRGRGWGLALQLPCCCSTQGCSPWPPLCPWGPSPCFWDSSPCSWGPSPTALPAATGTLMPPQTLRGCLGPTPQCCSHSDPTQNEAHRYALMENKENSALGQARRSMARTLGEGGVFLSLARHWGCCHGYTRAAQFRGDKEEQESPVESHQDGHPWGTGHGRAGKSWMG